LQLSLLDHPKILVLVDSIAEEVHLDLQVRLQQLVILPLLAVVLVPTVVLHRVEVVVLAVVSLEVMFQ
jgi:hypothetical protein